MHDANKQVVSSLVDIKLHLYTHGDVICDKSEEYKGKLGAMEASSQALQQDNSSMQTFMSQHQGSAEVTVHNIDELVKPVDAVSEKIIDLQSKNYALEDTM